MALLDKLKSLLGLDDGRSGSDRQGTDEAGVTVEREPGTAEPAEEDAPPASPAPGSGAAKPEPAAESEPDAGTDPDPDPDPDVDPEVEPPAADDTVDESTDELDGRGSTDEAGTEPLSGPEPDEGGESAAQPESEPLETVEPEPEDEADEDLRDIKGIGPSYETKLSEAGVDSTADLAAADAGELSAETGLSEKRIQGWIDRAQAR
ncbi:helix-hairpin-helix domain-containing protein [Halalkalicoccus tibetensis]|uniref:Helix-hairpin-helix domain-containing protein n=1 Tax=Halalkalicoccus tibetensis TaxID=175632 RepID=A0ABD5UZQ1_9EURY